MLLWPSHRTSSGQMKMQLTITSTYPSIFITKKGWAGKEYVRIEGIWR